MAQIRVLMIEDSETDADLVIAALRRGGYIPSVRRVWREADLRQALATEQFDLVLADYHLPDWIGVNALPIVKERGLDLPFILLSGVIGEEAAAAAMREGVHDFFLKDKLTRLPSAIQRELAQARVRRQQRRDDRMHRFLAQIGVILDESLDFRPALRRVVCLAVPAVADRCTLDLLVAPGRILRLSADDEHETPLEAADELAREAMTKQAPATRGSTVACPLVARHQVLGALTLAWNGPESDTELAQEVARRCARAFDNAQLFAAVGRAHDRLARVAMAVRDMANSPLQVILMGLEAVERNPTETKSVERMRRAVTRLQELDAILAACSATVRWGPIDEGFDAAAVIADAAEALKQRS